MAMTETSPVGQTQPEQAQAVIRRGGLCDLEAVAPLCAALRLECGAEQAAPGQVLAGLRHETLAWGGRLVVAQAGLELVGYSVYNMSQARLTEIFVAAPFRGQGIGRDLLAFAERDLERADVLYVRIGIDAAGERARAFFARHGFCPAAADELRLGWQKAL